ncbi:Glycosyltransferase family 25 (LPS biosynthesis protein) [compost metagenome]
MLEKWHALTKGEQGCFASHRALLNVCLNTSKPFLIMEDDLEFSDSLKRAIIELEGKIQKFEYCSGQLNPDTWLGRSSAFAGAIPSLC